MRNRSPLAVARILAVTCAIATPLSSHAKPEPRMPNAPPTAATTSTPPMQGADDAEPMPPANPHAGQTRAQLPPGVFQAPPDLSNEDEKLPAGTIAIAILDAENKPIPHITVNLGILHNSIAKGESREHRSQSTDDAGLLVFDHLETGSGIAYRVSVPRDGATFAASPFPLSASKGTRVTLHVYEVTRDMPQLVFSQGQLAIELKDDRVQLEEMLTLVNLSRTAWVPNNLVVPLPPDFTGFSTQQEMGDTGVDSVDGTGVRLRGTFSPGRHDIAFRWQLPYAGTERVEFELGLPPNFVGMSVVAAAANPMKLEVSGFPQAVARTDAQGGHFLITQKELARGEPFLLHAHVELRDLPTAGPASKIATSLAGCIVVGGLALAVVTRRPKRSGATRKTDRARLLAELADLELAHRSGDVGPKTYERARREIVDAIARTFA